MEQLRIPTKLAGLELREITIDDILSLFRLIDDNRDHLKRWCQNTAADTSDLETATETLRHELADTRFLNLGIWYEEVLIGGMYRMKVPPPYRCQIGYWLGEKYEGFGFATFALVALVSHVFDVEHQRCIVAKAHIKNEKSQAVLGRAGFSEVSRSEPYIHYRLQAK